MENARLDAILEQTNKVADRLDAICASRHDADWSEGDHPRAEDGKFGSGGGAGGGAHSKLPFVHAIVAQHGTKEKMRAHIETVPREKLNAALGYLERSGDPSNNHDMFLKKVIEKELDDRASSGR